MTITNFFLKQTTKEIKNKFKESNLALLKKKKALDAKRNKPQKQDDKYSAFVPNNTNYSYEELAMMDDGLDFMGLY